VSVPRARDRELLHRTARELEPTQLPYYVRAPRRPGELAGWWWIPPGSQEPEPLGSNVFHAHAYLVRLLPDAPKQRSAS
jgi:hypothetical protein